MIVIIEKYWFFYVCQKYKNTIYTYAVCETEEKAQEILSLIQVNG
jgi:hypothetical protein